MTSTDVAAARAADPVRRLSRVRPAPPVRILHLGLGAFSRSHLAWYTDRASDAEEWGIAAFTGRSVDLAAALNAQDGLFTLVERGPGGDESSVVSSIVRAHSGREVDQLLTDIASPGLAIVTLTITEAGYACTEHGELDRRDAGVRSDLGLLARAAVDPATARELQTVVARLVLGLEGRRRAGEGPLALVSCDNLPDNGSMLRSVVLAMAEVVPDLSAWCEENLRFVSTSVDRITPRVSDEDLSELSRDLGDRVPVVAEPFSDWVIEGEFPSGRPDWQSAGARITDDLRPWEARKLWTLNGAHTILAAVGPLVGHSTVADAASDPRCWTLVTDFWNEVEENLPVSVEMNTYRAAVRRRFLNRRIEHRLEQIALGSELKMALRIIPVARQERAAGRAARGCAGAVAAWMLGQDSNSASAALERLSAELASDAAFVASVDEAYRALRHRLEAER